MYHWIQAFRAHFVTISMVSYHYMSAPKFLDRQNLTEQSDEDLLYLLLRLHLYFQSVRQIYLTFSVIAAMYGRVKIFS